jgi:hypothetical protein
VISLVVAPAAAGTDVLAGARSVEMRMDGMHTNELVDVQMSKNQCHQVKANEYCKGECGCCMVDFSPAPGLTIGSILFSQAVGIFQPKSLPDPLLDQMIRPPRHI